MTQQLQGATGLSGMSDVFNSFVQTVRLYMRDYPELNRLVKGEEHSSRMIAWAIMDMLSDFAGTPPNLGYFTLEMMLQRHYQSFCLRGTVISLLQSAAILQMRNQLNFSDGGISVGVSDKAPQYLQFMSQLQQKYEQEKVQRKVALNIEAAMGDAGGVHSEYFFVNGWYGNY